MNELVLNVKYYSKRDSIFKKQRGRMCYSSTNAMLLEYLMPGTLAGSGQPDDRYLVKVLEFGDTVMAWAQIAALKSFGLNAEFSQSVTFSQIDDQLDRGIPVPIGILIWGPAENPSGGGHWILVIGRTSAGDYIVNDPYGELNLVAGGYENTNGEKRVYSRANLAKRFLDRNGRGWAILAEMPGSKLTQNQTAKPEKQNPNVRSILPISVLVDGKTTAGLLVDSKSYVQISELGLMNGIEIGWDQEKRQGIIKSK